MRTWLILILIVGCSHRVNVVSPLKPFNRSQYEAKASHHMIATQGEASSKAALSMLEKGGNIIDAFVAASFAISVERPQSTGIGGGGFLLFFNKA
jgi:gamma-glutamyltranspeptidase / glutathione hydrolase